MINPLECYNQHRSSTQEQGSINDTYHHIDYGGTISDPWKIINSNDSSTPYPSNYISEEMHDVVTPGFTKLMRGGAIINNPMERVVVVNHRCPISWHRRCINRYGTSPNHYFSGFDELGSRAFLGGTSFFLPAEPQAPSLNSWVNLAVTDAWAKVSVKQNDTIASVGEMRETISSLISIFSRVIAIYRDLKKLRLRAAYDKTLSGKALAEYYMFYRYALRPLVFEAQSYVDVLINKTILQRQTFRSYRTFSVTPEHNTGVQLCYFPGAFKLMGETYATRDVEIRAGVLCTLDITNNLGRWGITEPFEGLWELIPFSFIIDWFFNIGQFIAMWTPNFGIHTLASWYVVTDTTTLSSTVTSGQNLSSYNYQNILDVSGQYYKTIVRKWRLPDPSRPTLPMWRVNLDWLKTLDIGIILKQLISCKF